MASKYSGDFSPRVDGAAPALRDPKILAASSKLLTLVQEGRGIPKGVKSSDVISRETYDLDSLKLVSSEEWNSSEVKKISPLPPGDSNIHTVFTYKAFMLTNQQRRYAILGQSKGAFRINRTSHRNWYTRTCAHPYGHVQIGSRTKWG
eukprot:4843045-Amphidinium_carterae.3